MAHIEKIQSQKSSNRYAAPLHSASTVSLLFQITKANFILLLKVKILLSARRNLSDFNRYSTASGRIYSQKLRIQSGENLWKGIVNVQGQKISMIKKSNEELHNELKIWEKIC